MIKMTEEGQSGANLESLEYVKGWGLAGKIILPITRYLRAVNAEKYMKPAERHLDIGCGDGYFLRRSKCEQRYGLDRLLGDEVIDKLDFSGSYFDYVTMLAVIEHLSQPEDIFKEVWRVLKTGGCFIITTPRKSAEPLIRMYAKNIEEEHESYFDYDRIKKLAGTMFDITGYHTFIFGLNQAFCMEKRPP